MNKNISFAEFVKNINESLFINGSIFDVIYKEANDPNSVVKMRLEDIINTSDDILSNEEKFNLLINMHPKNSSDDIEDHDLRINSSIFLNQHGVKLLCYNSLKFIFDNYMMDKLKVLDEYKPYSDFNRFVEYSKIIEYCYNRITDHYDSFNYNRDWEPQKSKITDCLYKTILTIRDEWEVKHVDLRGLFAKKIRLATKVIDRLYYLIYNDIYVLSKNREFCKEFVNSFVVNVHNIPTGGNIQAATIRETNSMLDKICESSIKNFITTYKQF